MLSTPYRRVVVAFGTGKQIPLSNASATSYTAAPQSLYGIWDWDLSTWNTNSTTQYAALPYNGVAAPTSALKASSLTPSNLQGQTVATVTVNGVDYRTVTSNSVCWAGTTGCTGTAGQYGWYLPLTYGYANKTDVNLPSLSSNTLNPEVYEQVVYNPVVDGDTFIVNTVIPSAALLTNCFSVVAGGFTMAIDPGSGGSFAKTVFVPAQSTSTTIGTTGTGTTNTTNYNGIGVSGTGTVLVVTTNPTNCTGASCKNLPPCTPGANTSLVTQTVAGSPTAVAATLQCNTMGSRQTWIQRR